MTNMSPESSASGKLAASDKTVLIYGAIAALSGLVLHQLMTLRAWPWNHPFALAFLLQWIALAPLAGALLAGMRSGRRWLAALAAYGVILPTLTAYGLTSANGSLPHDLGGWPQGNDLALALLLTGVAGFILLPLIQALDAGNAVSALALARQWAHLFPGSYYIELQRAGMDGDEAYTQAAMRLAGEAGLPVVATHPVQ
ncbi:hypothetical protein G6F31_016991 [Rhizopus arrhizus]|nr:hypothetical protein G6F31_016991 [Rhizopus arrhizus]